MNEIMHENFTLKMSRLLQIIQLVYDTMKIFQLSIASIHNNVQQNVPAFKIKVKKNLKSLF